MIDLWGLLLANKVLPKIYPSINTPALSDVCKPYPNLPLPILTAVAPITSYKGTTINDYVWLEFNPYEMSMIPLGSSLNYSIPAASFGSIWNNGVSVTSNKTNELRLANLMGLCGSAFSLDPDEFLKLYEDTLQTTHPHLYEFITAFLNVTDLGELRLTEGKVNNPIYHMASTNLPLNKDGYIEILDGGLDFNLPLASCLVGGRNIDVFIIYDVSDGDKAANLKQAMQYAYTKGYPMPDIDYKNIATNPISIYPSSDNKPTIIYIPNMKEYSTYKLDYTSYQFDDMFDATYRTVVQNKCKIMDAIKNTPCLNIIPSQPIIHNETTPLIVGKISTNLKSKLCNIAKKCVIL